MPIVDKTIVSVSSVKQIQLTPNTINNFNPIQSFVSDTLKSSENADIQAEARMGLVQSGLVEVTPSSIVEVPSEAESAINTVTDTFLSINRRNTFKTTPK
jgi:hypothetical protein